MMLRCTIMALILHCALCTVPAASTLQRSNASTVSAYCHCAKCCGVANRPAANGRPPQAGITVAGPRWLPLGTRIYIQGIGLRVVTDRLARAFDSGHSGTERFDLFVSDHRTALRFGLQQHRITILK